LSGGAVGMKRGTAEQWIEEGKQAVKMTRLSCHRFGSNGVRLWLGSIAYSPGNLWPTCPPGRVLPRKIEHWPPTSPPQRLVKAGGRLVKHARCYWPMLAESHPTRRVFGAMVGRIGALPVATGHTRAVAQRNHGAKRGRPARRWWYVRRRTHQHDRPVRRSLQLSPMTLHLDCPATDILEKALPARAALLKGQSA
jgi:hypothetical protein